MQVLAHLEQQHRKVEGIFARLKDSEPGQSRNDLISELTTSLTLHMDVEERFVYPLVEEKIGDEESEEAQNEHDLAREGLAKLEEMRDEPGFGAVVESVSAGIEHHVHEEETEIFPQLRAKGGRELEELDPEELEAQVRSGSKSRESTVSGKANSKVSVSRSSSGNSTSKKDDLIDLTKDELYRKAKNADIPGRSTMTKAQLAEALKNV